MRLFKGYKGLSKLIIFSIALVTIGIISFASFAVKTYDPTTKTVTILNPLPAAEAQLIENTDQCLSECYAIIRFKVNNQLTTSINQKNEFKLDFIKESHMKGLSDYVFEMRTELQKQKTIFSSFCIPYNELINSTMMTINNCTQKQNGTAAYTEYEYVPFDFYNYTFQPGKDYFIKIKGKKNIQLGNSIDWIPTLYGLQINEWAWWNSSWSACRDITASSSQPAGFIHRIEIKTTDINYSKTKTYGEDIRILPGNCTSPNSGAIEENFTIAYWNTTDNSTVLLVNSSVNNNKYFAMYYNNSAAARFWNVTRTFYSSHRDEFNGQTDGATPSGWTAVDTEIETNGTDTGDARLDDKYIQVTANNKLASNIQTSGNFPHKWEFDFIVQDHSSGDHDVWVRTEGSNHQFVFGLAANGSSYCDGNAARNYGQILQDNVIYHITINATAPDNGSFYINGQPMTNCREIDSRDSPMGDTERINGAASKPQSADSLANYDSKNHTDLSYTIGNEIVIATESEARQSIQDAINASLGNLTIYTNQTVYLRYINGTQAVGQFDKFVSNGTKRWALNYVTSGESFTNMRNLTSNIYVWETSGLTQAQIRNETETLVNATR